MSRSRYIYNKETREGYWISLDELNEEPQAKVHINSDANFDLTHPTDGTRFTCKKAFRAHTKAKGCIEIGDAPRETKPRQLAPIDKDHLLKCYHEAKNQLIYKN